MSIIESIISQINPSPNGDVESLRRDLQSIAKDQNLDINTADMEDVRKIVSIYLQKIVTERVKI